MASTPNAGRVGALNPERWAQIEELFHRAAESEAEQRSSLLSEACRDDPDLRRQVEALLSCDRNASCNMRKSVGESLNAFAFPLAGEVVSHYRILDGLGGGGMGLVYRAEDLKLGRRVALKFLPEESTKDPAALGRFEREARSASALEHPNICPIYEFGEHDGQPFIVMQLFEGQTLRELISAAAPGKPPLPLDKLLDFAIQFAGALDAAHQKGIIHRDIKPANIFITSEGQAKILDFGLAKLAHAAIEVADKSESDPRPATAEGATGETSPMVPTHLLLSRTGVAMGTAGYMSPEQVRGEKLDARTDLFSFGLVLYEMATGERAFTGDTGPALHDAILKHVPSPARQLNPKLPAKLEEIINCALKKDREARYQSVAEMRADLETLKREMEPGHPPRWSMLAAAAVAVLFIVSAIFWFTKRQPSSQTLPDLKLQQLTINSSENLVTGGAISPDGKYLAYTDAKGMHIKLVGTDETQPVPQPEALKNDKVVWEIVSTAWFPDSKRFLANAHPASESPTAWSSQTSSIWVVSVLGGAPRKLRDNAFAWSVSPDGSSISFGTNKGKLGDHEIWLLGPNREQARKLYEVGEKNAICCLYFFPNGQRVSYITTNESGDTLVARDLKGGPVATLLPTSELKKMGDGSWLPDGRLIYSVKEPQAVGETCNYWTMRLDTRTGEVIDKPKQLTNWAGFCMSNPSVTADGKRLAFLETSSGHGTTYVADLEAGGKRIRNPRRFTLEEADDHIGDWMADSKTLMLVYIRGHHYGLYKQPLYGETPEPILASEPGDLEAALSSPDGKWVITMLYGGPSQPNQIMRVPFGGGPPEPIFKARYGSVITCAKAPSNLCAIAEQTEDRKEMIITAFDPIQGRGSELARFDADPDQDVNVYSLLSNISPDGTRLAAARNEQGPIQIRFLHDKSMLVIKAKDLNHIRWLHWAADGRGLFVTNLTKDGSELRHVDLKGNTEVIWKSIGGPVSGIPSPDGRHLAIEDPMLSANMWMMENF